MFLTAKAYDLRQAARQSLHAGDFEKAGLLAAEAQSLRYTLAGARLQLLSSWITEVK
jgi:hypothetical protein